MQRHSSGPSPTEGDGCYSHPERCGCKEGPEGDVRIPSKEYLLEKVNTGAKYYKGMNITYYGVPVMDDHLFDISKYFFPAAKFIHKALSTPESKS